MPTGKVVSLLFDSHQLRCGAKIRTKKRGNEPDSGASLRRSCLSRANWTRESRSSLKGTSRTLSLRENVRRRALGALECVNHFRFAFKFLGPREFLEAPRAPARPNESLPRNRLIASNGALCTNLAGEQADRMQFVACPSRFFTSRRRFIPRIRANFALDLIVQRRKRARDLY